MAAEAPKEKAYDAKESDIERLNRMKTNKWLDAKTTHIMVSQRRIVINETGNPKHRVNVQNRSTTSDDGMTFNMLALAFVNPTFYVGMDVDYLLNQLARLKQASENIGRLAPAWVTLQEVEQHALDFLVHALGGHYIASPLAAGEPMKPTSTQLNDVGCAILIHKSLAPYTIFSTKVIAKRGLALADSYGNCKDKDTSFNQVLRIASYHLNWESAEKRNVMYQTIGQVADEFKHFKAGCIGMDWNLFAQDVKTGLKQYAPLFAESIQLADYTRPTYLHGDDLAKCGTMDLIAHFGIVNQENLKTTDNKSNNANKPTDNKNKPSENKAQKAQVEQPITQIIIPSTAAELPAARMAYVKLVGSDHTFVLVKFPIS